ncbi:MAG TPA: MlaE family lipid ABC transporter permease subunit [Polyangiaceae bacterium]|nr:MlaE family lipid ABC transporter permease subunit [Polyangiaceae bacterium]
MPSSPWVLRAPLAATGELGRQTLGVMAGLGQATLFLLSALRHAWRLPRRWRLFVEHLHFIGNRSLVIVALTASFTGLVLALQGYNALNRFGADQMLGALVALSLTRELAPVLGALMVTARAGSAMAATLGNMQVTEQIDALRSMAIDPLDYLVAPRVLAGILVVPLLTSVFTVIGLCVAQMFVVGALGLDAGTFASSVQNALEGSDIVEGLVKSLAFGLLIVWIACFRGCNATGGAKGVGQATTRAVVDTAVLILAVDYVLTALLF